MEPISEIERMVATEEIKRLKARRDRALDTKDWTTYETLHLPNHYSHAEGFPPWTTAAEMTASIRRIMHGVTSVHHSHTPDITLLSPDKAEGIWGMEDNLFWKQGDADHWLRGFGFYFETYEKHGRTWLFATRRLERLSVQMSAGAVFGPQGAGKL